MLERIILVSALLVSCNGQQEDKTIAEWIVVSEDENSICLKETEDSEMQCYDKVSY